MTTIEVIFRTNRRQPGSFVGYKVNVYKGGTYFIDRDYQYLASKIFDGEIWECEVLHVLEGNGVGYIRPIKLTRRAAAFNLISAYKIYPAEQGFDTRFDFVIDYKGLNPDDDKEIVCSTRLYNLILFRAMSSHVPFEQRLSLLLGIADRSDCLLTRIASEVLDKLESVLVAKSVEGARAFMKQKFDKIMRRKEVALQSLEDGQISEKNLYFAFSDPCMSDYKVHMNFSDQAMLAWFWLRAEKPAYLQDDPSYEIGIYSLSDDVDFQIHRRSRVAYYRVAGKFPFNIPVPHASLREEFA